MKKSKLLQRNLLVTFLFVLVFVFTSCEKDPIQEDLNSVDANAKASPAAQQGDQTIAEIVLDYTEADEPQFTLLLAALEYTNLISAFAGDDNYTVFAPTDAAFLEFLGGDASNLYSLPPEAVANVLLYHVTDGRRFSNSVLGKKNWKEIEMLNEGMIYVNSTGGIDTNDEDKMVDSNFILPETEDDPKLYDIPATNGVIHVISDVLVPSE